MGCCGSRNEPERDDMGDFDDLQGGGDSRRRRKSSKGGAGGDDDEEGGTRPSSGRKKKKRRRKVPSGGSEGGGSRVSHLDIDSCGIPDDTLKFLTEEFNYRDKDRSNGIDRYELQQCMEGLGIELSDMALKKLIEENSTTAVGDRREIDLQSFIRMMAPYMKVSTTDALDEDQLFSLKQNFSRVDTDGNGTIDKSELKDLLIKSGKTVDDKQVEAILRKYDSNDDGVLSFEEFVEMVLVP